MPILDRRHFIVALAAGLGVAACGRRGPLEPPPYTAQGREWNRRQGRNPDGTPRRAGQQQQGDVQQSSVREGLTRDQDERTTRDVEAEVERNRSEGAPAAPSDPTQSEPGSSAPTASPTGSRRRPPGIVPPKQPFILDPLL
jgi:predicted small lipoprotein YifL